MILYKKFKVFIFPLMLLFGIMLIFDANSFFYNFNPFQDVSTMLAVTDSMFNGHVIFKDIWEQRGPYMYLLYGLTPWFGIHGLFLIELINYGVVFFIIYKIGSLTASSSFSAWVSSVLVSFVFVTKFFYFGGSPEGFILIPIVYMMYILCKMFKFSFEYKPSYYELSLLGFGLGFTFLLKYADIGPIAAFFVFYGFSLLFKKQFISFFKVLMVSIGGFIGAFIPWLLYFGYNNYIFGFFQDYLFKNLSSGKAPFNTYVASASYLIIMVIMISAIPLGFLFLSFVNTSKKEILLFFYVLGVSIFCISILHRLGFNYGLPLYFIIVSYLAYKIRAVIHIIAELNKIVKFCFIGVLSVIFIIFTVFTASTFLMFSFVNDFGELKNIKNDTTYNAAMLIKKTHSQSVLNYINVAGNVYYLSNTHPNVKYFDQTAISYENDPVNTDSQYDYIAESKADWVVTTIAFPTKDYIKSHAKGSVVASVTANMSRFKKYPQQYGIYNFIDNSHNIDITNEFPKALLKNYKIVDISFDSLNKKWYHGLNSYTFAFVKKSIANKYDINHNSIAVRTVPREH